jgi:RNA polymerase sigma-70 factor (ECF subfamily)
MSGKASKAEALWIQQACQGDQKAFKMLMERHYEGVLWLLKKRLSNDADAEDIAQQAFAKVFENIHSYSPKYAFSTWVYSIANNCYIDFVRKHKIRSTVSIDKLIEDEHFHAQNAQPNPEESMIAEQDLATTSLLLEKLKPQYRKVVELRYLKEYAYEEIAQELNIPMGTVKTTLFRAKEQLMKMIVQP